MKIWFEENKERLFALCGIFLVGILSFEAGLLMGRTGQEAPLVLSLPAVPQVPDGNTTQSEPVVRQPSGALTGVEPIAAKGNTGTVGTGCAFVGSKNSNKYHLPSCAVAKRIKSENRVCFASEEEAKRRGYLPSCLK